MAKKEMSRKITDGATKPISFLEKPDIKAKFL